MDFALADDVRDALDGWRRFIARDIKPVTDQYTDTIIPKDVLKALLRQTTQYGVGNGWVPAEDGGLGLDFLTSGLLYEALACASADLAGAAFVNEGAAIKLHHAASPDIKERYLGPTLRGELIGCSAISEPGVGSDTRSMRMRAVRDGDGYRLSGEKLWISNTSVADYVIAVTATGPEEFTMFLVDREEHGFETQEIEKLGLQGWSLGQITFRDAHVPAGNILGGIGGGMRETMRGFERSRCFISLLAIGLAAASLDASMEYARLRTQFGRPIGRHQLVQQLIAEMAIELEASRLMVYRALASLDAGPGSNIEASMAKIFATEASTRITSKAIQVHGAAGLVRTLPVERYFRSARMLTIPDGTTQINTLIVGRCLLGMGAFA